MQVLYFGHWSPTRLDILDRLNSNFLQNSRSNDLHYCARNIQKDRVACKMIQRFNYEINLYKFLSFRSSIAYEVERMF